MDVRVLNLDGSVLAQEELRRHRPHIVDLECWGPRIRIGCGFGRFRAFERSLARACGSAADEHSAITFCGSGDFHHVSLALLHRQRGPLNLLVIDNHPDWMRGVPIMHCGTWLHHAARLENVRQIFHVGGDVDFDNYYRWMAPWPALEQKRIAVFPARRTYTVGRWNKVASRPLLGSGSFSHDRAVSLFEPFRANLEACAVYISLDKDVLNARESVVNWDSGHLASSDVLTVLRAFLQMSGGRLAGMDVVGDWSPVRTQGLMRRYLDWSEHVPSPVDAVYAAARNEATNLALLEALEKRGRELTTPFFDGGTVSTFG